MHPPVTISANVPILVVNNKFALTTHITFYAQRAIIVMSGVLSSYHALVVRVERAMCTFEYSCSMVGVAGRSRCDVGLLHGVGVTGRIICGVGLIHDVGVADRSRCSVVSTIDCIFLEFFEHASASPDQWYFQIWCVEFVFVKQ